MFLADYHMHSSFSTDSHTPMEKMAAAAAQKGLQAICFCDHVDIGYPIDPSVPNLLDHYDMCYAQYRQVRLHFADRIKIHFGVELGIELTRLDDNQKFAANKDFDFIIGSTHAVANTDLYAGDFFTGKERFDAYEQYFDVVLQTIYAADCFDVYGHIDYVNRYGGYPQKDLPFDRFSNCYESIFKALIQRGKGLELNTSGFRYGLHTTHPQLAALKLYKKLGGEIVTLGSDAHCPADISAHFDRALAFLQEAGFSSYTVFEKRKPRWITIL